MFGGADPRARRRSPSSSRCSTGCAEGAAHLRPRHRRRRPRRSAGRRSTTARRRASTCPARRSARSSARSGVFAAVRSASCSAAGCWWPASSRSIATLVGWLADARQEYRETVEADTTGHLENVPAPRDAARLFDRRWPSLIVGAIVLQSTVFATGSGQRRDSARPAASRRRAPPAVGRVRPRADPAARRRRRGCRRHASTAKGIAFVETTFTAPRRQAVHDRLRQPGRGHAAQRRAQGRVGRRRLSRARSSPASRRRSTSVPRCRPGTYTFVCTDPPDDDGDADAPVGRRDRPCRVDRSCSPCSSRLIATAGRRSCVGRRSAGGGRRRVAVGQPAPAIVGTTLDGAPFDLASLRGQAGRHQLLGTELRALPRRVPAARGEARRARRRRARDRRRADRRPGRTRRATSSPSTARRGRPSIDPDKAIKTAYRVAARPQTYFIDRTGVIRLDPGRRADRRRLRAPVRPDRAREPRRRPARSSSTGWSSATAARTVLDGVSLTVAAGRARRAARAERRGQDDDRRDRRGLPPRRRRPVRVLGSDPATGGPRLRARVGLMLQGGGIDPRAQPRETLRPVRPLPSPSRATPTSCSTWSGCGPWRGRATAACPAASASGSGSRSPSSAGPRSSILDEPTAGMDPRRGPRPGRSWPTCGTRARRSC